MTSRLIVMIAVACLLAVPASGVAQTAQSDVTFKVPLNLTNVSADLGRVQVYCTITNPTPNPSTKISNDFKGQAELPVSGGQLVTTATVVVPVSGLDNATGKTANYTCKLSGFSTRLQSWSVFSETPTSPAFRLSPAPADISGTFIW